MLGMLVLAWLSASGTVQAQELPFAHYVPEGGVHPLPSASVALVHQDTLGFMWISAFSSGLVRYDGHSSELYTTEDGLRDLGVQNLVEDAQGRMWAGSRGGLVVSEEPLGAYGSGRRIRFTDHLGDTPLTGSSVRARRMALDADGWMWVGTKDQGLLRYDTRAAGPARVDTLHHASAGADSQVEVAALAAGHDGAMWVAFSDADVVLYRNGRPASTVAAAADFEESYPTALYEDGAGILWIGTAAGQIYRTSSRRSGARPTAVDRTLRGGITDLRASADGTVWAASEGGGLLRLAATGAVLGHYTRANGLLSDSITRILQDREKNLWFAQLGGLSKLRHNFDAFRNYTAESHAGEQPVLPAPSVGAVVEAGPQNGPCQLWGATAGGGVACIGSGGASAYLQPADGLYGGYVNALGVDRSGQLWIGTTAGIQSLTFEAPTGGGRPVDVLGRRARLYSHAGTSVYSISVLDLPAGAPSRNGAAAGEGAALDSSPVETVWFTHNAELSVRAGEAWYTLQEAAGLPNDRLHAVAADDGGHIWVATRNSGIYRSTRPITLSILADAAGEPRAVPGRTSAAAINTPLFAPAWSTHSGAPVDEVYGMLWHDGLMWAATAAGVAALTPDSLQMVAHLTTRDGLGDDFTMSLSYAPSTGTLWVGSNGGLTEIDPAGRQVLRTVTKADGLIDSEVWYIGSVRVARDGTVRFGTAAGLAEYRPSFDQPSGVPPLLQMRRVALMQDGGRNEINFEYAALSFANEPQVRYRTRLLGYDEDWSGEKPDERIRYTNLPAVFLPRTYTFEAVASNADGLWSETPLSYAFTVHPPPWLRWWAISLYVLILAASVFSVAHHQRARLIKRERERAQLREAELAAETALARSQAAEAHAKALAAENERKETELGKARELKVAYGLVQRKNEENERLLLNILPATVAERLKGGEHEIADSHPHVTILFSDLVGFTSVASRTPAGELVHLLNLLFSSFDRLALEKGVEKIKTIGDAYMAVSGLPEAREDHAAIMADMALDMLDIVDRLNDELGLQLALRIGLHSGPVTAGVIGMHKFAYDVWGDAVNTAARMESHGIAGRIHITEETRSQIEHAFHLEARGMIEVKGKGSMATYLIRGRRQESPFLGTPLDAATERRVGVE